MDRTNHILREDALTYLPHKPLQEFPKAKTISAPDRPANSLFLFFSGRVKIATSTADAAHSIVRVVSAEGLFGENCLLGPEIATETAVALDNVHLMAWSAGDIEAQIG